MPDSSPEVQPKVQREASPSPAAQSVSSEPGAPVRTRSHIVTIARLSSAVKAVPRAVTAPAFERLLEHIGTALDDPDSGDRTLIWVISTDGTRMRQVSPHVPENPWVPADGAVAQVLGARQSLEMGLILTDPRERATARSTTDENRDLKRSFGRFLPVFDGIGDGARVVAVVGSIRRSGRPMFDRDDRVVLDAAVERIEAALVARNLADELAAERSRGVLDTSGLFLTESLLRDLGNITGDVVIRHLFNGLGTQYISDGVERAIGYSRAEVTADPALIDRIVHPEDRHVLSDFVDDPSIALRPLTIRLLRRDGNISWHLVRIRPVLNESGAVIGFEGLTTDVTAMKVAEAELAHQARSDSLTGLSNRLNFREATTRAIARIERHPGTMAVLFLDLDGFKLVNDTLGHPAGDEVLRQVADRLRRVIRREDLVARLGGDEFAVLLAEIRDVGEAASTARRILEALEAPITVHGSVANISTGVGIAVADAPAIDADELISRADIALYQAKRVGRGRWQVFEGASGTITTTQQPIDRRLTEVPAAKPGPVVTEGRLRVALAGGEFRVHYLPQIDMHTSQIVGVEALVRWDHPEFGMQSAQSFIDVARSSGVVHALGDWVIREASQQVSNWRRLHGTDLGLWVNICGEQLQRDGFAETVLATLHATGLPAKQFGIDVAEIDFADLDAVQEASLTTLSRAGIRLALDDFGQGGSSLRSLRKLPLAQIKIGRSYVETMESPTSDTELVPLTVKLANSLGATVVAIGVERFEQLQQLRIMDCGIFEGSLGGDTHTADSMSRLLADGQLTIPGLQARESD